MSIPSDHGRPALGHEERLALLAATAEPADAQRNWERLMSEMRFDEVNDNTQRIAPAIFSNLRGVNQFVERDRLRGAFKHAWSKNTGMLFELRSVFEGLTNQGIEFRVIKGAAVQAVCGRVGARFMGDVDVLVHDRDVALVEEVFLSCGFRRNSDVPCSGHSDAGHFASLNFNKGSAHADVHIAEVKQPTRLFRAMLSEPGVEVRVGGTAVRVPSIELLVLHAASHGSLAAGPTDVIQAALDISLLRDEVDRDRLVDWANRTRTVLDLRHLDRQLAAIDVPGSGVRLPRRLVTGSTIRRVASRLTTVVTGLIPVARRMRVRYPGREVGSKVRRDFPGRGFAYRVWLAWGKFSSTERLVMRRWGGFLDAPVASVVRGHVVAPFVVSDSSVARSPVPQDALDWRFRFRVPDDARTVWLEFRSPSLDRLDPLVYVNGIPAARLVAGDETSRRLRLRDVGPSFEISIRPLGAACSRCFAGLDDLRVMVEWET